MYWKDLGKSPRTMYIGTYYHTIEATGRVSVPAAFRTGLGVRCIAGAGVDGNVNLFSQESWDKVFSELSLSHSASRTDRDFVRLQLHQTIQTDIDDQGRILVPEVLRDYAKLQKHVVFAGSFDHVEIWDRDTYHQYMDELKVRSVEVSNAYAERHHA